MDTLLERDDDPVMLRQPSTRAKRIKGLQGRADQRIARVRYQRRRIPEAGRRDSDEVCPRRLASEATESVEARPLFEVAVYGCRVAKTDRERPGTPAIWSWPKDGAQHGAGGEGGPRQIERRGEGCFSQAVG